MKTIRPLLMVAIFLCSLFPLDSISASQNSPTLRVQLFEAECGGQAVFAEEIIVYDSDWKPILWSPSSYSTNDHQWSTNLAIGESYKVEAYSENMLIASDSITLQSQNTLLQFCNGDTSERVPVSVAVYDDGVPLEGVRCILYGYNHYAMPQWEWQSSNNRITNTQGICSWDLYPTTQNIDKPHGEKYRIEFEYDAISKSCEGYQVPENVFLGTLVFDISSNQKDCNRLLSEYELDIQTGNSPSICDPNNDGDSGEDSTFGLFGNKVSLNTNYDRQDFYGCLGGIDDVDVYTYDSEVFATVTLYDENDVVQFTSHSSSMVSVGGGATTEFEVRYTTSTNDHAQYRIEVVVDSVRTNEFLSVTQPRILNMGPNVINCISSGKASLLYNVADPQGQLTGTEVIVLEQTIINSDFDENVNQEHILGHCPNGTKTLELQTASGEILDSLTFHFVTFEISDTTDNVLFIDQQASIYLSQALGPGNCISFVQFSQRDALNGAAGVESNEIRTSRTPWTCGAVGVYEWQFQAKFLGSLSNTLVVEYKTGIGATPQLIYRTEIYVLPKCSEVLEEEGLSSVESYLFIDCEGNEPGLVVYEDKGAGDLSQNKWEILNKWDEKEYILFFSKTTVITESGDSYSHVPLLVPTLVSRCEQLEESLTQLREIDPGPGGLWNWVDVVGTAPEFADSFSNYNEVEQRLSSSVLSGDCMVQSEYHRSLGHSLAVLPVIDDWQSMAFLPATDTSTQRLLEWCESEMLRCDPVTRTNNHVQWDGVECSSYLEYSIVLTYQYDDPLAASFQWDGPMSKYDPSQPQVWYDQATECLGVELLRKAQFEQSLDMLFLLIDIISVTATIASSGVGAPVFMLSGMFIKNTAKKGMKEGVEQTAKITHRVANKNQVKNSESLKEESSYLRKAIDEITNKDALGVVKILENPLEFKNGAKWNNKELTDEQIPVITHRVKENIGILLLKSKGENPKINDFINDFLENFKDVDQIESYLWELETLSDAVKRIKMTDKNGLRSWDKASKETPENHHLAGEFGNSEPDFVFENVFFEGTHYEKLIIESKLSVPGDSKQLTNLLKASKDDNVHVVYYVKKYDNKNVDQLKTYLDGPGELQTTKWSMDLLFPSAKKLLRCSPPVLTSKTNCEAKEIPVIAITALSSAFLLPSDSERGRSMDTEFYHISSTCSEESFLLSSYGVIDAGVLWAYATLDDEGIKIHHEADCEILIEGVEWSTEVRVDEESGEAIPLDQLVANPKYTPTGPIYSIDQSGSFQNLPPVFKSLNPFTSTAILRGDGLEITSYYMEIEENEQREDYLRFNFSNAVSDLDGELEDLQLHAVELTSCDYRNYFFVQTEGLNLTITPIKNASTDMVIGTASHQVVPESGFYCSIRLLVYDSPFPPTTYPADAEYVQGVGTTILHVRLSDIDGKVEQHASETDVGASNNLSGLLLVMIIGGGLVLLLRRYGRESNL